MIKESAMSKKVVHCTLIGDGMVGKTSLSMAFVNKEPPDEAYVATVFDNYAGTVSVHGEQYTVGIFDSPGQHDYENVRAFSYRDSEVIIACYSVADTNSLQNIKDVWIQEAKSHVKTKKPIILVGCQIDARDNEHSSDNVSKAEGVSLAKEIGAETYLECSSVTMDGVSELFQQVVSAALKNRKRKSSIIKRLFRR